MIAVLKIAGLGKLRNGGAQLTCNREPNPEVSL